MKTFGEIQQGDDLYLLIGNTYYKIQIEIINQNNDELSIKANNKRWYGAYKQDTIKFYRFENSYITPNKELIVKKLEQERKYIDNQIKELNN